MSKPINTIVKKDNADKNEGLKNIKKQKNTDLKKTLDELRASKGFRELGDMLYLDDYWQFHKEESNFNFIPTIRTTHTSYG